MKRSNKKNYSTPHAKRVKKKMGQRKNLSLTHFEYIYHKPISQ